MRLFDEHVILRFALLITSFLFAALIPDILEHSDNGVVVVPYIFCILFLDYLAVFYRFPSSVAQKKMRSDVNVNEVVLEPIRNYERDLIEKDRLFQMMIDVSSEGFWTFDVSSDKVFWSNKVGKILGIEMLGDSFDVVKSCVLESDWESFRKSLQACLNEKRNFTIRMRLLNKKAGCEEIVISGRPQCNEAGLLIRVIGSLSAIQDSHNLVRENDFLSTCDSLTGVSNRQEFLNELAKDVEKAAGRPDYIFAIALLDIDSFAAINDSYSIDVGDQVLRIVADRISASSRAGDCIARIGPDVFALIFRDIQGDVNGELISIVRNLHSKVKMPLKLEGKELYISVSMSVVVNKDGDCVEDLLANANAVLRDMKKGGNHGGVQFFTGGIREKAMNLYRLEFDIRRAIQAREFILMYQPIVDIVDGDRIVGFEALVRWNNSERGIISPGEFIPIAEETGLIVPMGAQILRMACEQTKIWVDMGYENIQVSVNFSAKQFALDNMVEDVRRILQETRLNPKNLKLEITEYTALCESEKTIEMMRALASMGLQISIDDFGTGYSSLSYLKRFPVNTLKMDKSFVDHVTDDEEDASFARMVIGIANSMNLGLIAEGVETRDQLDFLRSEGCRFIQGFYFSKPLNSEAALAYLRRHYSADTSSSQVSMAFQMP
ncbi:MAG: GGDEF domain-containing protein [Fibrobacter sp.]|uniref:sensor domain-containing protein n=1 Tax=Fibrobacter sp. TaxID=35828 RepID=UPI001B056A97|nr:bifunctional diguanylate cyclase/phosphodiesterase [Fibrobacter sp.]MBO7060162.1 GGDEF domain-containing protein [Fibrobacter sp.]MBO7104213.1 GGDEF domain-containing protein [Fibrobacter sp.]